MVSATRSAEVVIGGERFTLVPERSGKRGLTISSRPSQGSDPGQVRRAQWQFGPSGYSREQPGGYLGTDDTSNLSTRTPGLLVSAPALTDVDLAGDAPHELGSSVTGHVECVTGEFTTGGPIGAQPVTHIVDDHGVICVARG